MSDLEPPILPEASDVIGAGKARLVEVRPSTEPHIEDGNYGVVFTGYRGQFDLARARLETEVRAARKELAEGDELSEVCASNYDTPRSTAGATTAIGGVTLTRSVVHWFPSSTLRVTAADATDFSTLSTLLTNIYTVFNTHAASVFVPATGVGAHRVAETETLLTPTVSTMGDVVTTLNTYKTTVNDHLARAASDLLLLLLGSKPHAAGDTANKITAPDAFASDAGAIFDDNTVAAQQSALVLANAVKKALNGHMALRALPGTVREGTRWRVDANPAAVPPIAGGEYIATQNTYVRCGAQTVIVPTRAAVSGTAANVPIFSPVQTRTIKTLGSLFDAAETLRLAPFTLSCAGGGPGQSDDVLRRAATANWLGQFGPTDAALVTGSLSFPGVAQCPILKDITRGENVAYPVDGSWAQSPQWFDGLEEALRKDWLGVGCRLRRGTIINRVVRIELLVNLRSRAYLSDTTAITAALLTALRSYFDARPDWWIFRLAALRAVCSRAHRRILKCTSAVVRDANGEPIDEPEQPSGGDTLTHWWFADGAVDIVYDAPV